ncbi:hypothetical protein M422DRAFT_277206 [Sphaerobolus stellatus SS14]|uniref:Uncharacterized protein n=1 Tax=Sphaerobolus stellatus (strain SS14) TaxID=990650 RepID=A0A0C9T0Y9_SPHS4|nr:hypothetical protein M422DRAFT_277206 [Sphaerobolus stellatus SS14]
MSTCHTCKWTEELSAQAVGEDEPIPGLTLGELTDPPPQASVDPQQSVKVFAKEHPSEPSTSSMPSQHLLRVATALGTATHGQDSPRRIYSGSDSGHNFGRAPDESDHASPDEGGMKNEDEKGEIVLAEAMEATEQLNTPRTPTQIIDFDDSNMDDDLTEVKNDAFGEARTTAGIAWQPGQWPDFSNGSIENPRAHSWPVDEANQPFEPIQLSEAYTIYDIPKTYCICATQEFDPIQCQRHTLHIHVASKKGSHQGKVVAGCHDQHDGCGLFIPLHLLFERPNLLTTKYSMQEVQTQASLNSILTMCLGHHPPVARTPHPSKGQPPKLKVLL